MIVVAICCAVHQDAFRLFNNSCVFHVRESKMIRSLSCGIGAVVFGCWFNQKLKLTNCFSLLIKYTHPFWSTWNSGIDFPLICNVVVSGQAQSGKGMALVQDVITHVYVYLFIHFVNVWVNGLSCFLFDHKFEFLSK